MHKTREAIIMTSLVFFVKKLELKEKEAHVI